MNGIIYKRNNAYLRQYEGANESLNYMWVENINEASVFTERHAELRAHLEMELEGNVIQMCDAITYTAVVPSGSWIVC
jgi:hypothetical protein